jgi:regulator of sigma E protease
MHLLITIVTFLVIFSILILVHEWGHFFMARRNGVKVEEFGFGLPPRLWGKKYGGVLYSINWIPFGGFVRMLGEDPHDKKAAKDPRSFACKTKWQRSKIVCAGVFMNFVLAWVLLSIGFVLGMQPLMVNSDDFLQFIRDGRIDVAPGLYVDNVEEWSIAEYEGFVKGDKIKTINGLQVKDVAQINAVIASGENFTINGTEFDVSVPGTKAGFSFNVFEMPRVIVGETKSEYLKEGDVIWAVNGQEIFYASEIASLLARNADQEVEFTISRDQEVMNVEVVVPQEHRTVISHVFFGTPAEEAGIEQGDVLVKVNNEEVWLPEQAVAAASLTPEGESVTYEIERDDIRVVKVMGRNNDGYVGVLLGLQYISENQVFSYYDGIEVSSVTEIHDVQYPVYEAPVEAFSEMGRISVYTAAMVGQLFGNIFTTASVPEGVAGPVGIAQMTGLYVQEGFVALLRFLALLSLSLGVINIFPFPALDGGRMAFIIVEAIRGKPVDAKIEGLIHSLGFIFLIIVIFMVTFQDIARLFG